MQGNIPSSKSPVIAVDFDGTLAFNSWPITERTVPNKPLIKWLSHMHLKHNAKIIIWSCRENYGGKWYEDRPYKNEAYQFCMRNGMSFPFRFNEQVDEEPLDYAEEKVCRKIMADLYIDDHGFPFRISNNRFIRWVQWKLIMVSLRLFFG